LQLLRRVVVEGWFSVLSAYRPKALHLSAIGLATAEATPLIVGPKLFIDLGPKPLRKLWSVSVPRL